MTSTGPLSDDQLLHQLHWRYATKRFDPSRIISPEDWRTLEEALVLSASSYGLQPYRFLVITDPQLRKQLSPAANNQPQITDASHLVVFCAFTEVTAAHVDRFIELHAASLQVPPEKLASYKTAIMNDLVVGPRHAIIQEWCKRQTYLALGNLLASAAMLGIDACPMEGFKPPQFDTILGLPELKLSSTVLCTLGYRSSQDRHATEHKTRFPAQELIIHR